MNLLEYINNSRTESFYKREFSSVDALALACFSYINFGVEVGGLIDDCENATMHELAMSANYEAMFTNTFDPPRSKELFENMLHSKRFGNIQMNYYINELDIDEEKQFSAVTIFFGDCVYISFRGTDNTFLGWKEDFNMAYISEIPSQTSAVEYINRVAEMTSKRIYIGGHSKGGNLAIYSAIMCKPEIQERIIKVYSFDGPGFKENIYLNSKYDAIADRVYKYVPKSSVIGMLLEERQDYVVVDSKTYGILQHNAFQWIIKGNDFKILDGLNENAKKFDIKISKWLDSISDSERKMFVDVLFDIIAKTNINTIEEFKENWANSALAILKESRGLPTETKEFMKKMISALASEIIALEKKVKV